jgi:hypothetical protein
MLDIKNRDLGFAPDGGIVVFGCPKICVLKADCAERQR